MSAEYVFRISKEEISRRFDITMDVVYGRSVDKIMERVFGSTNVCDRWGFDRLDREALEAALKDAKSQALITQKNIKVVLTDTSTNKNLKLFYVGDDTTKTVPLATYTLDKNISIITDASNLTAVSFTPYKNAYPGDTGTRPDNTDTDSSTIFSVCYGAGSDKYTIMVDASSNIVTSKNGTCS